MSKLSSKTPLINITTLVVEGETTLARVALEAYRAGWERHKPCLANEDWDAAAQAVRDVVLEEAAQIADRLSDSASDHEAGAAIHIATAIRALKAISQEAL